MSETLELSREEIRRLSYIKDDDGHAWLLYLLLKKNINIYTGVVQVDCSVLANTLACKMQVESTLDHNQVPKNIAQFKSYLLFLINMLIDSEIITDYTDSFNNQNNTQSLAFRLPIALSDTCLEPGGHH